jgi:O-antigen/teichoic acid export membrane protein
MGDWPDHGSETETSLSPAASSGIALQAVRGSFFSVGASTITLTLGFVRSVLLARWLLPEHFGVVALALFFIGLVSRLRGLGFDMALIHRREADETFLRTYFTVRTGFDILAFSLLVAATPFILILYPGMPSLRIVLPLLIFAYILSNLSQIQETLLRKNLAFSSLASTDVIASVIMTLIAPYLAWHGWGIWALVAEQLSGLGTRFLLTWGLFRQWWPKLGWNVDVGRWLWQFGKPTWVAANSSYLNDNFDDFWTGTALGGAALGFYSRAYEFAIYPRRVLANPLVNVFIPIFAQLQDSRLRLSRAFYRSAHLIIRTGFVVAGIFSLVMPEFIQLALGEKWLPMLWTFRLMIIYTILDPFLMLIANLLLATGRPQQLQNVRLVQLVFFIPAVMLGAWLGGINGVALAANGMLLVGAWRFYRPLREAIDFSLSRLVLWPSVALALAWGVGFWAERSMVGTLGQVLLLKVGAFLLLFGGFLLGLERGDYVQGMRWLWKSIRERPSN